MKDYLALLELFGEQEDVVVGDPVDLSSLCLKQPLLRNQDSDETRSENGCPGPAKHNNQGSEEENTAEY